MGQSRNADLPGGALTASREAAQQTLSAANAGIRNAQLDASQKLSASRDEAVNLKQSIAIQRRQQLLGEQTRALYQDQYLQLGTRPLLDLLNVDQEIYQAQFNQVLTEAQLRNLELDCLFSTGKCAPFLLWITKEFRAWRFDHERTTPAQRYSAFTGLG